MSEISIEVTNERGDSLRLFDCGTGMSIDIVELGTDGDNRPWIFPYSMEGSDRSWENLDGARRFAAFLRAAASVVDGHIADLEHALRSVE